MQKTTILILSLILFVTQNSFGQNEIKFTPKSSTTTSILPKPVSPDSPVKNRYTSVSKVFELDGTYYMLYNDLVGGWPSERINVMLAKSQDLESWELIETPLLNTDDLTADYGHDETMIFASAIIENPKGGFILYFDILDKDVNKSIGVAYSESLLGPWTVHPEPIISPDAQSWDSHYVTSAYVINDADQLVMYYTGTHGEGIDKDIAVMRATSEDGISWNRETMPVFRKNAIPGLFDSNKVENPQVFKDGDRWVMIYRTDVADGTWAENSAYGIASSWDGINWQRLQNESIISEYDVQNWRTIWSFGSIKVDDVYHLFLEYDGPPVYATRINHAVYEGSIPSDERVLIEIKE